MEDTSRGTLNSGFELGVHFRRLEKEFAPWIFTVKTTEQRIALSEQFLLKNIHERRNGLFTQVMREIFERRGACAAGDISKELYISRRQLERFFAEYLGLSPKKMAALVRYQYLWHDILAERDFNATDKALEYSYADQSHLLKDFKRFHTMSSGQAREFAFIIVNTLKNKYFYGMLRKMLHFYNTIRQKHIKTNIKMWRRFETARI